MKTQPAVKMLLMSAVLLALVVGTRAEEPNDPFKKPGATAEKPVAPAASDAPSDGQLLLSLEEETFSLPIGEAFALLRKFPADADRYNELVRRVEEGNARLERLIQSRTVSGIEVTVKSVTELIYPAEYSASTNSNKASTFMPTKYETREVGDTLNATVVLGADGEMVSLTLTSQRTRFIRYDGPDENKTFHQPQIDCQSFSTAIACRVGEAVLLGTFNPSNDNGLSQAQEQRVWLSFMTVHRLAMGKVRRPQ